MLQYLSKQKCILFFLVLFFTGIAGNTQPVKRTQPIWWFGASTAANFNHFRGTTQVLNNNLTVPTAFHQGDGIKPYASVLAEVRGKVWGGMLNVAYDNRGGKFNEVMAPCNCPANLTTNIGYVTVEPSLRIAPFSSAFYVFAGPTIAFNVAKTFEYTQLKQPDTKADWSDLRSTVFAAQFGAGIDIPLSRPVAETQMTLSPFASFQTDLINSPRKVESWSIYTIRAGIALKFGTGKRPVTAVTKSEPTTITNTIIKETPAEKQLQFSVRAPKVVPANRQVKETFPLRKSVFFDMGSTEIPGRYVLLNQSQASSFKEEQLQEDQPGNLNGGRSARQLAVYHNILNIMGDRMRANPKSMITLTGASDKDPAQGKLMAENVKQYLVSIFGIDAARILTDGRDKPLLPSEQPGGTKELALLREGDRRVDISSVSPELLLQVGGANSDFLRPVQIRSFQRDPLDSHVIFTNLGASELLDSWSIDVKDEQNNVQHYGPYTQDQASVPGKTILGSNTQGNYAITMRGQTKTGHLVTKESSVSLVKSADINQEGLRYSILFDFDKSKTQEVYEKFLVDVVTPLIPENATVIIHGHTDIIGEEKYNLILSNGRAKDAQNILERALANAGKKGIRFETYGFGEDQNMSPFENNLVEERFYNRTVIIDIITNK